MSSFHESFGEGGGAPAASAKGGGAAAASQYATASAKVGPGDVLRPGVCTITYSDEQLPMWVMECAGATAATAAGGAVTASAEGAVAASAEGAVAASAEGAVAAMDSMGRGAASER